MQQTSVWDLPGDSAAKQQAMEEFARMEKDQKVSISIQRKKFSFSSILKP
jgi:hypothetical protein